jgi:hypothetical protein
VRARRKILEHRRMRAKDITGKRFSRLVVTGRGPNYGRRARWNCLCDCGGTTLALTNSLNSAQTRSCGCLHSEMASALLRLRLTTHGESKSAEYNSWSDMKSRCYNPRVRKFHLWGGRGITVCKRWFTSFPNFLSDMGKRPTAKHSLDRFPNKDGNYEPGNCRWATSKQQACNRRSPLKIRK